MAPTITFNGGPFNGHVGITAFREGRAESDNPGALAFFRDHPDYTVHADEPSPEDRTDAEREADEQAELARIELAQAAAEQARAEQLAEAAAALAAEVARAEAETQAELDAEPDAPQPDDSDDRPEDEPAADPYELTHAALRKLCADRGIPQAGNKADLQERLRAADAADTQE